MSVASLRRSLLATCLALGGMAGAHAANLVADGDFETPVVSGSSCFLVATVGSWSSNANDGSCYIAAGFSSSFATPFDGQQLMYINNDNDVGSTVTQLITLTAGQTYQLNFEMAGLNGDSTAPMLAVNIANGTQLFSAPTAGATWTSESFTFTSTVTGTSVLGFTARTDAGVTIDAVSIAAVPEPATVALMVGGLALVGGAARSRRKSQAEARA